VAADIRPVPAADELAAIVVALASIEAPPALRVPPPPSRWKIAARDYARDDASSWWTS
jgi:hypothetical protein